MVSGELIRKHVVRHIEQSMPWLRDAVRIEIDTLPDISGLPEKSSIKVETVGAEEYVGEVTFIVRVSDGRQNRLMTVHGRMEILRDIAVAARPVERDTILTAADISIKKKWVRNIDPALIDSPEHAVGKRVVLSLRSGAELKTMFLKEPVLVKKGKTVRINLERGSMKITAMGISEEDGAAGAMIRVKNMSSDRIVFAKVTSEDTVKIEF
ncbi:MAG: flagellar basal body P-ring formation chaperone FlgA [Syntrophales bacterium]|nr:flagellar basal body P-ring formation chaperone FlgA [Syntrophales bacterium]